MKRSRFQAAILTGLLGALTLPVTGANAATGVTVDSSNVDIGYFVALNSVQEADDFRDASDFTSFNETLTKSLQNSDTSAKAKVQQNATVDLASDSSLEGVSGRASMEAIARGSSDNENCCSVSSPFADLSISFQVTTEVHYSMSASLNASNNDSDDCSYAVVSLEGPVGFQTVHRQSHAGGDCDEFDPSTGSFGGVLPPGGYTLTAEAEAAVAGDDASASGSASYGVGLSIYPPCDVTGTPGDDTALEGTPGEDVICALGGNDNIDGQGGNDIIFGDEGNDNIEGGAGLDEIFGGTGND